MVNFSMLPYIHMRVVLNLLEIVNQVIVDINELSVIRILEISFVSIYLNLYWTSIDTQLFHKHDIPLLWFTI